MRTASFLLHLDPQVTYTRVVQRLAATVVDFELAGAENFECFLERLRPTALARTHSTSAGPSAGCASRSREAGEPIGWG